MEAKEREIQSKHNYWKKSGTDVTPGKLILTDRRLLFAGHAPRSFGQGGVVGDLLGNKVIEHMQRNKEKSFELQLSEIRSVRRPDGITNRGALDVEGPERTYRIMDRKRWQDPLRDAVAATGANVIDDPDGKGWSLG